MPTIKKTFPHAGEKVTVELNIMTAAEHNEYAARRRRITEDEDLPSFRAKEFDRLYVSGTLPKDEIFDAAKSSVMFQLFENFSIDEKNL